MARVEEHHYFNDRQSSSVPLWWKSAPIGDWEGDTVIGKAHKDVLVTLVERKSRYALACQLNSRHSALVGEAAVELLRPHKRYCKTLTFDNGKEFADHGDQVNDAVYSLNHRPRKGLGYRTPHEVFYGLKMQPIKLPTDALCS
jgi:IS30 family transposase